jgi:hypothetical protein
MTGKGRAVATLIPSPSTSQTGCEDRQAGADRGLTASSRLLEQRFGYYIKG